MNNILMQSGMDASWAVVITVLIALGTLLVIGRQLSGAKDGRTVSNEQNESLRVQLEEQFVTRREFDEHRGDVRAGMARMEGLFHRSVDKMEELDKRSRERMETMQKESTERIEKMGEYGYEGRGELHGRITDMGKEHGERIARLESDVTNFPRPKGCEKDTK